MSAGKAIGYSMNIAVRPVYLEVGEPALVE